MLNVIHTCLCFRAYICTNTCLNIFHVKNPQFLNILAQFLTHYQHFCKKKKKKVMRHPKVRREGTRNNFVFLCGLMYDFQMKDIHF